MFASENLSLQNVNLLSWLVFWGWGKIGGHPQGISFDAKNVGTQTCKSLEFGEETQAWDEPIVFARCVCVFFLN